MTAKPLIRIVDDDEALTASSAMLLEAHGLGCCRVAFGRRLSR